MSTVDWLLAIVFVSAIGTCVVQWQMLKNRGKDRESHSAQVRNFVRGVVDDVDLYDQASRAFEHFATSARKDGPAFVSLLKWLSLLSRFPEGYLAVEGVRKVAETSMEEFKAVGLSIDVHDDGTISGAVQIPLRRN
jgi:hypothetical protein